MRVHEFQISLDLFVACGVGWCAEREKIHFLPTWLWVYTYVFVFCIPLLGSDGCSSLSDAPVCKQERNVIVGVSKGERVSIKCELEADPQEVSFRWDLATSGQMIQVSPSRYSTFGSVSLLHYAPVTNLDYGSLFCRGSNVVGSQMAPCVFQVVAAGEYFLHYTTFTLLSPFTQRWNTQHSRLIRS